jgi:bifunctional UDP-N-acetylglucosamine pyrophosphorylase/glucosamine-1-phosphate N-acetyltransferase
MNPTGPTASIVMAAGRGSRMKRYEGSKTLLPLAPDQSPFSGTRPILLHILENLPLGPRVVVVNHRKEDIIESTRHVTDLTYCEQPVLNGTGGALLAARSFLENRNYEHVIITMGDVPFVSPKTYAALLNALKHHDLTVLGFVPRDKKQYGLLDVQDGQVQRIIEWKYWKNLPSDKQKTLSICNSGIYSAKRDCLLESLSILSSKPHVVQKEISGTLRELEEFFITDLVEYLPRDRYSTGYIVCDDEYEVMGVDDLPALLKAQEIYRLQT